MGESSQFGSVAIEVGTNHGAIVVGDHNTVTLNVAAPPRIEPRVPSDLQRPRAPAGFLDRRVETAELLAALATSPTVRIAGPRRIGKSWFLQQAGDKAAAQFAEGALILPPGLKGPQDALQAVFEMFYSAVPDTVPSLTRLRGEWLGRKQALLVIDDSALTAADLAQLRYAAPGCAVLLSGESAADDADAASIALGGLPLDDAMALAEQVNGAALTGPLYAAVLERCRAVAGHPQQVKDAVRALVATARDGAPTPATAWPEGDERTVLDTVLAHAPAQVPLDSLAELSGVQNAPQLAARLAQANWLQIDAGAARLGHAAQGLPALAVDEAERLRVQGLVRLGHAARSGPMPRRTALLALPLLWLGLAASAQAGRHAQVLALGEAWHAPLTLSGRWDAWRELMQQHLLAARASGDVSAQAWALHQSGTRALGLGQLDQATALFREALPLEAQIGDATLHAATEQHLDLIGTLLPALPPMPPAPPPPRPPEPVPVRWGMPSGVAAILVGGAGIGWMVSGATLQVQPASIDFGAVALAGGAPQKTLDVRNTGWRGLQITALTLDGEASAAFRLDESCAGRTLRRGESCRVQLGFIPRSRGAAQARLTVRTAEAGEHAVPLAGRVQAGELQIPRALDFGAVDVGADAVERPIELHNTGDAPLVLARLAAPGAPFSVGADACSGRTLEADQTCTVTLRFRPTAASAVEQRLSLASNEPGAPAHSVTLTGVGLAGDLVAEPTTIDFGPQELATVSEPTPLRLANRGTASVRLGALALSPTYSAFKLDPATCRGATLAPGSACELHVSFAPRAGQPGRREAVLRAGSAPGKALQVALSGQGAVAQAQLRPPVVNFGTVDWSPSMTAGAASALPKPARVVLTNQGDAPLRLGAVKAGGASVADFPYTQNCPPVLAPGATCEFTLRYRPRGVGASDAYLTLDAPAALGDLRLPLLGRALDTTPAVPVLLYPKEGATLLCSAGFALPVEFVWRAPEDAAPGPLRFVVAFDAGGTGDSVTQTRQTRPVACGALIRWRVEAIAANQKRSVSPWRTFRTVRSGSSTSSSPSPAPSPSTPSSPPPPSSPSTP